VPTWRPVVRQAWKIRARYRYERGHDGCRGKQSGSGSGGQMSLMPVRRQKSGHISAEIQSKMALAAHWGFY
jgi:hypothetical protein